jgi:hypothetical protein
VQLENIAAGETTDRLQVQKMLLELHTAVVIEKANVDATRLKPFSYLLMKAK